MLSNQPSFDAGVFMTIFAQQVAHSIFDSKGKNLMIMFKID